MTLPVFSPLLKIGLKARISPKNNLAEEDWRSVPSYASPDHENKPKRVLYAVLIPLSALPISRSPLTYGLSESPDVFLFTPQWI